LPAPAQFVASGYGQFAEVAKAPAHGHRLEILEVLAQGERSVEPLAERAEPSIAKRLAAPSAGARGGPACFAPRRQRILDRLSDPSVLDLIAALRHVAERNLAEVREVIMSATPWSRSRAGSLPGR
jgi:DNA-binding transcriptional ArsR family regulator